MFLFGHGMSCSHKTCQDWVKNMRNVPSVLNVLIPIPTRIKNTSIMISNRCVMLNLSKIYI